MNFATLLLGIGNFGGTEILLIGVAIILLFGAKRIPELFRGMGQGIREFKDATDGIKRDIHDSTGHITEQVTEHIQEIKKEIEKE